MGPVIAGFIRSPLVMPLRKSCPMNKPFNVDEMRRVIEQLREPIAEPKPKSGPVKRPREPARMSRSTGSVQARSSRQLSHRAAMNDLASARQATIDRHTLRMLRRRGGYLLRQRRVFLGLTQRELAERVSLDIYTIVSQLESGIGRIEPYQYEQWAHLELPISRLVARVLEYTDPVAHRLFVSQVLTALH